jgi:hypothetical protein
MLTHEQAGQPRLPIVEIPFTKFAINLVGLKTPSTTLRTDWLGCRELLATMCAPLTIEQQSQKAKRYAAELALEIIVLTVTVKI